MMRAVVWLMGAVTLAGVWYAWRLAPVDRGVPAPRESVRQTATNMAEPPTVSPDSLSALIVGKNPFRRERRPAPMRLVDYEDRPSAARPPPKPPLRLAGLIHGSVPSAVIDGVPGAPGGAVMAVGDTLDGLVLAAIAGDTVRVTGVDTTWVLILKRRLQ